MSGKSEKSWTGGRGGTRNRKRRKGGGRGEEGKKGLERRKGKRCFYIQCLSPAGSAAKEAGLGESGRGWKSIALQKARDEGERGAVKCIRQCKKTR